MQFEFSAPHHEKGRTRWKGSQTLSVEMRLSSGSKFIKVKETYVL